MDNNRIVDTLIACGVWEYDEDKDLNILRDTPIDLKYWLDKGKKYNVNEWTVTRLLICLVYNKEDRNKKTLKNLEIAFDMMYGTFLKRGTGDFNFIDDMLLEVCADINTGMTEGVFEYEEDFGTKYKIDNEVLILNTSDAMNLKLVDEEKGSIRYENVVGLNCDMETGDVNVLQAEIDDSTIEDLFTYDEGIFRVVFYNMKGESLFE